MTSLIFYLQLKRVSLTYYSGEFLVNCILIIDFVSNFQSNINDHVPDITECVSDWAIDKSLDAGMSGPGYSNWHIKQIRSYIEGEDLNQLSSKARGLRATAKPTPVVWFRHLCGHDPKLESGKNIASLSSVAGWRPAYCLYVLATES